MNMKIFSRGLSGNEMIETLAKRKGLEIKPVDEMGVTERMETARIVSQFYDWQASGRGNKVHPVDRKTGQVLPYYLKDIEEIREEGKVFRAYRDRVAGIYWPGRKITVFQEKDGDPITDGEIAHVDHVDAYAGVNCVYERSGREVRLVPGTGAFCVTAK